MSYQINRFNGAVLTVLQDGTIDTTTTLPLVGRNTTGYGEIQNENFVFLLENFSNDAPPSTPISGQLWFNNVDNTLNSYDGDSWNPVGSAARSDVEPENPPLGSFWLRTTDNILFVYDGTNWEFVGPNNLANFETTRDVSSEIRGQDGKDYPVILHTIDNAVIAISSNNNFNVNQEINDLPGFDSISPGMTLRDNTVIDGNLIGLASRAEILDNTRTINGVGFNGSRDISIFAPTPNRLVPGEYIKGSSFNGEQEITWDIDATDNNVIGTIVARDSRGDFSAGTITADLVGNVEGNIDVSVGTSRFNVVEANQFIGQSLSGNAATATRLRTPRTINGVSFDGTEDITVTANAKTLTNDALASTILFSNLQRVGTLEALGIADNGVVIGNNAQLLLNNLGSPNITAKTSFSINLDDNNYLKFIPSSTSLALGGENINTIYTEDSETVNLGHSSSKFDKIYANTFEGNATSADTSTLANNIIGGGQGAIPYQTGASTTGFVAPSAPGLYLSLNSASEPVWDDPTLKFVENSGDTMTGFLTLHADPINSLHAATKNYVDNKIEELDFGFTGQVAYFAMSSAPDGWLKANGAEVSRATYSELFAKIGTVFGGGNGSTTFNLPDLRGEFIRGWDDGRGVDSGRSFASFQADEFRRHNHTVVGNNRGTIGSQLFAPGLYQDDAERTANDLDSIGFSGGNETRPRNIALLACIKY